LPVRTYFSTIFVAACLFTNFSAGSLQKLKPIVIDHVAMIDVAGGPVLIDRVILISGDKITAIANSGSIETPKGAQVVNATGEFLIPGLWDMHVHIAGISANPSWAKKTLIPLLIANGITGIRDMGGDLHALKAYRGEIESGQLIGPQIFASGPMLLPPARAAAGAPDPAMLRVGTPAESREAVDRLQKRGAPSTSRARTTSPLPMNRRRTAFRSSDTFPRR
jgi:imidazolonepropionase-like amidohydrolase